VVVAPVTIALLPIKTVLEISIYGDDQATNDHSLEYNEFDYLMISILRLQWLMRLQWPTYHFGVLFEIFKYSYTSKKGGVHNIFGSFKPKGGSRLVSMDSNPKDLREVLLKWGRLTKPYMHSYPHQSPIQAFYVKNASKSAQLLN